MSATEETLALLRSIDASLKQLVKQQVAAAPRPIASDRELDSQYGDPLVKLLPRDWTGPSYKDRHFSECPAAFLDLLAEMFDYFGQKNEETKAMTDKGKPKAQYDSMNAARARGWAKRVREGHVAAPIQAPPPMSAVDGDLGADDINW